MREILFRGKICRDCKGVTTQKKYKEGDWAFGDLSHTNYTPPLIDQSNDDPVPVDLATVGQYTGLTGKNGKRIFEGDIVRAKRINTDKSYLGYVIWWLGCFAIQETETQNVPAIDLFYEYEVIGNIHDNPELVKGECT